MLGFGSPPATNTARSADGRGIKVAGSLDVVGVCQKRVAGREVEVDSVDPREER